MLGILQRQIGDPDGGRSSQPGMWAFGELSSRTGKLNCHHIITAVKWHSQSRCRHQPFSCVCDETAKEHSTSFSRLSCILKPNHEEYAYIHPNYIHHVCLPISFLVQAKKTGPQHTHNMGTSSVDRRPSCTHIYRAIRKIVHTLYLLPDAICTVRVSQEGRRGSSFVECYRPA